MLHPGEGQQRIGDLLGVEHADALCAQRRWSLSSPLDGQGFVGHPSHAQAGQCQPEVSTQLSFQIEIIDALGKKLKFAGVG